MSARRRGRKPGGRRFGRRHVRAAGEAQTAERDQTKSGAERTHADPRLEILPGRAG
jgi:hypothetical protein